MKTRGRPDKRTPSARDAVRAAAATLFAQKGFAATTTREICQCAGITKPVLYYHFKNKQQLFRELLVDCSNESRKELLLTSRMGASIRERMIEILAADFLSTKRNPELAKMFIRAIFAPTGETPAFDYMELVEDWIRIMSRVIADGIRKGEIRGRPRDIAEAIFGVHTIYTMAYLLHGDPDLDRKLASRIVDLFMDGCAVSTDR